MLKNNFKILLNKFKNISSNDGFWFLSWAKKEFRANNCSTRGSLFSIQSLIHSKTRFKQAAQRDACPLEKHRGRRSEPAGMCRLRKQVTDAKEGPLETGSGG